MPKPGSDKDESIDDGMFDFLSEDAANRPARPTDTAQPAATRAAGGESSPTDDTAEWDKPLPSRRSKPLPVIRKPVPVSESGPNVSPFERTGAGAKTKSQPSPLAQRVRPTIQSDVDDSFDFLSEEPLVRPKNSADFGGPISTRRTPDNATDFGSDWNEGVHEYYDDDDHDRPRRRVGGLALGALVLAGLGVGAAWQTGLLDEPLSRFTTSTQSNSTPTGSNDIGTSQTSAGNIDLSGSTVPSNTGVDDAVAVAPVTSVAPTNTVAQQFREALAGIEALMAAGDLSGAERALDELDPRVLGYGNPEFTAIRLQIANGGTATDAANITEQERAAEAQRLADAAVLAEQQRLEAEQAAQLQAERDAQLAALAEAEEAAADAAAARAAEQQRLELAREATRLRQQAEADRIAAEEARVAQEALAAEQARLAAQQAETERLAAEALAEQQAAAREAAQEAAQAAAEKAAEEEAARAAEQQQAEQQALAVAREAARQAEAQRAAEARAAEQRAAEQRAAEQRAAEQRAAAQREAEARAAQARVAEARAAEREAQLQAEAERLERERLEAIAAEQRAAARQAAAERAAQASGQSTSQASSASSSAASSSSSVASTSGATQSQSNASTSNQQTQASTAGAAGDANRLTVGAYPITDADFNAMYKRFIAVKNAIESRDINAVTQLAQTNGARVQSLLQLFSNSESISAKIDNVSTRNSTGMIVGTLTINQVTRRGGNVTQPPANLKTFTLTSRRDAAGWSKIQW